MAAFFHLEKEPEKEDQMSTSPNLSVNANGYEALDQREQKIREDMRGVFAQDSIDRAIREERERSIGTPGEVQTYRFSAKTTDGREIEQMVAASNVDVAARQGWDVIKETDQAGVQIASARLEWESKDGPQVEYLYDRKQGIETYRPEGITLSNERGLDRSDEQRHELRGDWQRRQEWNGLIEGGSVAANPQERSVQDLKPPAEMTNQEIVNEARELHAEFSAKMARWEGMPAGPEKTELREEMKPLAIRENELRQEYTGRVKAEVTREVSQDQVPEMSVGYGR